MNELTQQQLEAIKSLSDSELSKLHSDISAVIVERTNKATEGLRRINDSGFTPGTIISLPSVFGNIQESDRLRAISLAAHKEFNRREIERRKAD